MSNCTRGLVLLVLLFLPACAKQTEVVPIASSTSTIETQGFQGSPTPSPTARAVSTPTIEVLEPTPEPFTGSLAGLIYYDQQGIWKIALDGKHELIYDFEGEEYKSISISPNLDKIMYRNSDTHIYGDLVADIRTGETVESNYGDYTLCWTEWWPARPDLLLVGLHPVDEEIGYACNTVPAIKLWNGPIIETLGTEYTFPATKAGSPDGSQVAFDDSRVPFIFTWGQGKERFDYRAYGFPHFETISFSDPVWSPSGRWLAWFVWGKNDEEYIQGIALFDMVARTSRFLTPFEVLGFDGGRGYLDWSSDEKNLMLMNPVMNYLRVINIETQEIVHSSDDVNGYVASISPDGLWLAYDEEVQSSGTVIISLDQIALKILPSFRVERWSPDSTFLLMRQQNDGKVREWPLYIFELMTGKYFPVELPAAIQILAWAAE